MTLGKGIEQLQVFAVFFALGVGLSLVYIFGVGLTKQKISAIVFDGIFGATAVYLLWKVNLECNNGEFRVFTFVGLIVGCVATYFTCKRALDKLSSMLYNLFTTELAENNDGKDLLQKVDGNPIRRGNTDTGIAGLSATHKSRSNVRAKRAGRNASNANRRRSRTRTGDRRTARVSSIRRIRETMGRTTRSS